jgi:hypothetical protein
MILVLVALAASALLGLVTGLVFPVCANAMVGLLIAFVSATALHFHGFGFSEGVLVTIACLFVSQAAYFVGVLLESCGGIASFLADEVFDDEPDDNGEHHIAREQDERCEHPSRPPPPET